MAKTDWKSLAQDTTDKVGAVQVLVITIGVSITFAEAKKRWKAMSDYERGEVLRKADQIRHIEWATNPHPYH